MAHIVEGNMRTCADNWEPPPAEDIQAFMPDAKKVWACPMDLVEVLLAKGLVASGAEAKRLIRQGAIELVGSPTGQKPEIIRTRYVWLLWDGVRERGIIWRELCLVRK